MKRKNLMHYGNVKTLNCGDTTIVELTGYENEEIGEVFIAKGKSICQKGETFDEEIGYQIALTKAKRKLVEKTLKGLYEYHKDILAKLEKLESEIGLLENEKEKYNNELETY